MKITYTAPNRSHHYPFADALHSAGHLHAFVSGFSRFSPRSGHHNVGEKLKRHDFLQTLYYASLKLDLPTVFNFTLNRLSNYRLDQASYPWAKESDVFIYYRTQGYKTSQRLRREGIPTLCVMEEVNSHVDLHIDLQKQELERLGLRNTTEIVIDHALRLKAYEEADCILCPSEFVRRSFLEKGFTPDRLIMVNFGFPHNDILAAMPMGVENKPFRVLYVGQIHYRKGLYYAIEAFRKLNHPKKEFIIVGPKTPITGLEKTQIPEGVVFTGALKGEALKEQYRRASVFILPSIEDGFGLVVGEALTFGVPILTTLNTGAKDVITNGVEGFTVPPMDVTALAERLQQMADDEELLTRMSIAALQAARKLGDWNAKAELLISKLTTILTTRGQPLSEAKLA